MQAVGEFLSRLGFIFPIILFFLVITSSVTMVLMALVRLARRNGAPQPEERVPERDAEPKPAVPSEAAPVPAH